MIDLDDRMPAMARSLGILAGSSDNELCGYIFQDGSFQVIPNLASNPKTSFFMDPQAQLKAVQDYGDEIAGVFHTHPRGSEEPSPDDDKGWHPRLPWRYFIVTRRTVTEFAKDENNVITRKQQWKCTVDLVQSTNGNSAGDGPPNRSRA